MFCCRNRLVVADRAVEVADVGQVVQPQGAGCAGVWGCLAGIAGCVAGCADVGGGLWVRADGA